MKKLQIVSFSIWLCFSERQWIKTIKNAKLKSFWWSMWAEYFSSTLCHKSQKSLSMKNIRKQRKCIWVILPLNITLIKELNTNLDSSAMSFVKLYLEAFYEFWVFFPFEDLFALSDVLDSSLLVAIVIALIEEGVFCLIIFKVLLFIGIAASLSLVTLIHYEFPFIHSRSLGNLVYSFELVYIYNIATAFIIVFLIAIILLIPKGVPSFISYTIPEWLS